MLSKIIKQSGSHKIRNQILLAVLLSCAVVLSAWTSTTPSVRSKPSNNVWQAITSEFKLDHKAETSQVKREIRVLLAEKSKLHHILNAATPYIYFIHQSTQSRGLPAELTVLPFIESEFNPYDRSSTGALGLWQLMHGTAKQLGVKMSGGYDGRRNIIESTRAALAHLKYLGSNFKGNWYFALAAYNCGQGRIESAHRHYGTQPVWYYPVPTETKRYVARILALAHILKNHRQYGIELPAIENKPYFAEVTLKKELSLAKIADNANINLDTLHKLNPDYRSGRLIKKEGGYRLLVPSKKADAFKS